MQLIRVLPFLFLLSSGLTALAQNDTVPVFPERIEIPPQYPGGDAAMLQFLKDNFNYPEKAVENGIEGTVVVSFVIEKDGHVGEAKILKSAGELLDGEALRLVNLMPRWEPATVDGRSERVQFSMPIKFYFEKKTKGGKKPMREKINADSIKFENYSPKLSFFFLGGYTPLIGEITNYTHGIGGLDYGLHIFFRRYFIGLGIQFAQFAKTKQDFEANGYWRKGRNVSNLAVYVPVGYQFYTGLRWKVVPYAALSLNQLLAGKTESGDPQNRFNLKATTMEAGALFDYHFGFKKYSSQRISHQFLRLKLGYKYLKFNDFLKGSNFLFEIGWGLDLLSTRGK